MTSLEWCRQWSLICLSQLEDICICLNLSVSWLCVRIDLSNYLHCLILNSSSSSGSCCCCCRKNCLIVYLLREFHVSFFFFIFFVTSCLCISIECAADAIVVVTNIVFVKFHFFIIIMSRLWCPFAGKCKWMCVYVCIWML